MNDGMTMQEIATHFGITRQAVEQIINKALLKLRRELMLKGINQYDDLSIEDAIIEALRTGKRPQE